MYIIMFYFSLDKVSNMDVKFDMRIDQGKPLIY